MHLRNLRSFLFYLPGFALLTTHPRPLSFWKEICGTHLIFLKRGVVDLSVDTDNANPFAFSDNSPPAPLFLQRDLGYAYAFLKRGVSDISVETDMSYS
jgi:hypothetical protein